MSGSRQDVEFSPEARPQPGFTDSIGLERVFDFRPTGNIESPGLYLKATHEPTHQDPEALYVSDTPNMRRILPPIQFDQVGFSDQARKPLEPIAQRQKDLTAKYKVQFVEPGRPVPRFWKIENGTIAKDEMTVARAPSMRELDGLEAALKRSQPSQLKDDGTGVKIAFLSENSPDGTLASFWAPQSLVMVTPGLSGLAATVRGDMRFDQKLMTIEAVLTHEFSHNHEDKLVSAGPSADVKYGPSAGWIWAKDTKTWMLLAKDGSYYAFEGNGVWTKRNESGERVDASNKVANSRSDALRVSNDEMQRLALIRPVTGYFDNPLEMYAEAMMMYRLGNDQRKFLRVISPVLYEVVKDNDQAEISRVHGRTPFGNPNYVRDVDGFPKPDSPEIRKRIAELER